MHAIAKIGAYFNSSTGVESRLVATGFGPLAFTSGLFWDRNRGSGFSPLASTAPLPSLNKDGGRVLQVLVIKVTVQVLICIDPNRDNDEVVLFWGRR